MRASGGALGRPPQGGQDARAAPGGPRPRPRARAGARPGLRRRAGGGPARSRSARLGRRPGRSAVAVRRSAERLGPPAPGAGALQLLGLDPELGRVHAEPPGRLARQRGGLLGIGHLGEDQGHARVGGGAAARRGQVLLGERPLEDEGEEAAAPRRAARVSAAAPSARRRLSGSWPGGQERDLDREVARPSRSRRCARRTSPGSARSITSFIISSSAASRPSARPRRRRRGSRTSSA